MKEYISKIWNTMNIIVAALIIGASIIIAAKTAVPKINTIEVAFSENTMRRFITGMRDSRYPGPQAPAAEERPEPGSKRVEGVLGGSNPVKGDTNAPVLMVEFSDFQCPFSHRFYQDTFPQIEKEYIAGGKLKFAYRDFPLGFHPLAKPAAVACRCAGKQGRYWEMFDKLGHGESQDAEKLQSHAKEIGLDMKTFGDCLNEQKIKDEVENDLKEGARLGISGTPAFFINGRFIEGAYPFDAFKKIIEEELRNSKDKGR
jgi:protein-disulfide isomerase